ncbi:Mitochondrial succinate-fumarate transporter [Entomophthora muscae]|uniref:Mitochondrial succinate-fumarate transporter n=1 Tax=Entomophthora muscae TaxID=34485 RepID=A0ACC2UKC9_9FUNG|nr:Mitochondrial succinate-fumarate transporter [Entomophthora muscae]
MSTQNKKSNLATHLIAGGTAGLMEACICHPLDTIKVRMQLKRTKQVGNFFNVGAGIITREGPLALYKGLGAVVSGIVPKMAIRFSSFEYYKSLMAQEDGTVPVTRTFLAGLGAGVTEAVLIVTPMDVVKIRLQAQRHPMMDPLDIPRYRNAAHAMYLIVKEEGVGALYKGIALTALRQATNQAVNFAAYQEFKKFSLKAQDLEELPSYQHLLLGGLSGAMGPMSNAPIDTIKTRIQRQASVPGESAIGRVSGIVSHVLKKEGWRAFYRGLTPRLMRVAPGQAITFMVYEKVRGWMEQWKRAINNEEYSSVE